MNKKKYIILGMIMISLIILVISIDYNKKEGIKLEEVVLTSSKKTNNSSLAIMVQKEDGSGYEKSDTFPSGLALNTILSGCIDKDGEEIDDAIEYNVETMSLKLKSKGSNYCYLYFLRDSEPPVITITIIDNYYTSAKMSITSNEESTYCINTSSTKGDTSNCTFEGVINENSIVMTKTFTNSGIYYIHAKDTAGNETISEAININVLYQKVEYIEGTGTQYIDTGLVVNKSDTYRYIIEANFTNSAWGGSNGYLQFQASLAQGTRKTIKIDYASYYEKIYVNDVLNITNNWTSSYNGINVKIGIFKMGNADNSWYSDSPQQGKIYSVQIFKSGTLVRNFVPVYRIADNVVGLLDTINNVFYTNVGSGTFGKGNNIE